MIEATPLAPAADAIAPWQPAPAQHQARSRRSRTLQPLLDAAAVQLGNLFGRAATLEPLDGRDTLPSAAAALAGLRLGGPLQAVDHGGSVTAHYRAQLASALQPLVDRLWPRGEAPTDLPMVLTLTPDAGEAIRLAVTLPAATSGLDAAPATRSGLAADLPLRVRVELASEDLPASRLVPLEPGLLLPVTALPEMPLRLGDHCIGRATVVPLPDGRQQATIVAIDIRHRGGVE